VRDFLEHPLVREFYTTSTFAGVQHRFGSKLKMAVLGEYIRSWQVQETSFAIAQAMRPAVQLQFRPTNHWTVDGSFAYSRAEGFHPYDNMQSGFFISYIKPFRRMLNDGLGEIPVEYPLRFSIGFQQQSFFNFAGRSQATFRPVVRLTFF